MRRAHATLINSLCVIASVVSQQCIASKSSSVASTWGSQSVLPFQRDGRPVYSLNTIAVTVGKFDRYAMQRRIHCFEGEDSATFGVEFRHIVSATVFLLAVAGVYVSLKSCDNSRVMRCDIPCVFLRPRC